MYPNKVEFTEQIRSNFPDTSMAFMLVETQGNLSENPILEEKKLDLAAELHQYFPDKESILKSPIIQAYQAYYQRYNANYHVRFQIESVALKGKPLPTRSVLVDAMYMAELLSGLLIAGHDMNQVKFPLTVDCGQEGEFYTTLSGELKSVKENDLCIRDADKILSTILYGPEQSSPITLATTHALYCIYGPNGIPSQQLEDGLNQIADFIHLALPQSEVLWKSMD